MHQARNQPPQKACLSTRRRTLTDTLSVLAGHVDERFEQVESAVAAHGKKLEQVEPLQSQIDSIKTELEMVKSS